MELRFGTRVSCDNKYWKIINLNLFEGWYNVLWDDNMIWDLEYHKNNISDLENHWNPLQERHLRMYFESIAIWTEIRWDWTIQSYTGHIITKLDNTRDFHEQEDKVLLDIINFFKG